MNPRFDSLDPQRGSGSFIFSEKRSEVVAHDPADVVPALREVEAAVLSGAHAAGFVAYEAGPSLEPALATYPPIHGLPLLHFGIFDRRTSVDPLEGLPAGSGEYTLGELAPSISPEAYAKIVRRIMALISAGDTYQVNYTLRLAARFSGNPYALYRDLCLAQRSAYCACLELDDRILVSASPELFFRVAGSTVEMRPMKGTRPRGRWTAEDDALAADLASSAKDRAENLMIVDLLRNDLGRVARFGSVQVPELFEIERYPTVHQLTSTVTAELRPEVGLVELFTALFPSGSVTGAPKIRTSQIIRDLEDSPRGAYTGAIGFVSSDEAVFSVAIRTLMLSEEVAVLGVGSGITADSDAASEYRESLGKAAFLRRPQPIFEIFESLRLDDGGYPLLEEHLQRMEGSARYFGFPYPEEAIRGALASLASGLGKELRKVRLRLSREGRIAIQSEEIPRVQPPARLTISPVRVDPSDPFLYHKTTNRGTLDAALAACPGNDDVLLMNTAGEVTQATRANLVLEIAGDLFTPPIESGLLPGVVRGKMIEEGRVAERVIQEADVRGADKIYLINAVRGWREGQLV